MTPDFKTLLDTRPMVALQYATIFVCFLMNMLDGMDVLVISYTAPAIAADWNVSPETLGVVFSAGLTGMTLGTLLLAPYADYIGRKSLILISASIMGVCILATAYADSVTELIVYRFLSGLGIGSMLASTATLAAEYTPNRTRDFWVSFVVSGYPVGAVLSGLVAAKVIPTQGWQQMFVIAGVASLLAVPIILLFLSESLDFLLRKQPKNALNRANQIIEKMGLAPIEQLPELDFSVKGNKASVASLFMGDYKKPTLQLWLALFMVFAALFFMTSWIPKLATLAGLSMELAIYAGTVFNVGAFLGIITQGYFSSKYGLKRTIGIILLFTAALMSVFGLFVGSDWLLVLVAFLGFGIQGGFVGMYAVAARMYPTEFRNTGVGWAMGAGRLGGIVGPMLGGLLIGAAVPIGLNFMIFAVPAFIAGLVTMRIASKNIR
jgi:benzoate transport